MRKRRNEMKGKGKKRKRESIKIDYQAGHSLGTEKNFNANNFVQRENMVE